jgi:hypothetical protein
MRCTAAKKSSCAGSAASACASASRARDKVDVPPKRVPYFKPGKELKDLINKDDEPPSNDTASSEPESAAS